jgi:GTP-binding protein
MAKPIVAIVGRPNVGKSSLFNRFVGERRSIVEDLPGTTRDRLYGTTNWNGRDFIIIDTAGIMFEEEDNSLPLVEIARRTRDQAHLAIDEADAIIFLVDAIEGMTTSDTEVAEVLRSTSKPVILGANKCDNTERALNAVEFYALNLGEPIPMSAYHGIGGRPARRPCRVAAPRRRGRRRRERYQDRDCGSSQRWQVLLAQQTAWPTTQRCQRSARHHPR